MQISAYQWVWIEKRRSCPCFKGAQHKKTVGYSFLVTDRDRRCQERTAGEKDTKSLDAGGFDHELIVGILVVFELGSCLNSTESVWDFTEMKTAVWWPPFSKVTLCYRIAAKFKI